MKLGVVIFPGSNCDQDLINVLQTIENAEVVKLWHKDTDLKNCDFIFLPGGFSYGDYLRSGAIARYSPIMQSVTCFANEGGYVMGICNGFQILCEAGLLPGALLRNVNRKFICENVYLIPANTELAITNKLTKNSILKIPIAHGEGCFYADQNTMKEILDNEQVIFYYCNSKGEINYESNPNGSLNNIAGICNKTKNVFGMMPHPERCADISLFNTDGKAIFDSIKENFSLV
ncbi:MAG: phosphoribosylformylglycinamidine synthase subunit PurQ [Bacteroidetes bacterium]|nr:phosphoribosylformylglycinamidine synthase subunit PurQ [Bacteroidota bacterium]